MQNSTKTHHMNSSAFRGRHNVENLLDLRKLPSFSSEFGNEDEFSHDVESLVYYFSVEIPLIPLTIKKYSFFTDPLRRKMILKFMKFYSWCPNLQGDIHDQRRMQLKLHLKLREGQFSQQLSSFMVIKFKALSKKSWISGDSLHPPVKYHEVTDHWLEQSWDGKIRPRNRKLDLKTRSLKQAATSLSSQPRNPNRSRARKLTSIKPRSIVTLTAQPETVVSQRKSSSQDCEASQGHESIEVVEADDVPKDVTPVIHNLITPDGSISAHQSQCLMSNVASAHTSPVPTEIPSERRERRLDDSCFSALELSELLEGLSEPINLEKIPGSAILEKFVGDATTRETVTPMSSCHIITNPVSNMQGSADINDHTQTLESLVESARSCRTACNDIGTSIRDLNAIRSQLCTDYNKLHEEIKALYTDAEEADKRLKNKKTLSPALGVVEPSAAFHKKVPEIRQKLANREWLESRKRAEAILSKEIKRIEEKQEYSQEQHRVRLVELEMLCAAITDEKLRIKKRKTEIASLLEDFEKHSPCAYPEPRWIPEIDLDSDEE